MNYQSILAPFDSIVGQTRIVSQLSSDIKAYIHGGPLKNYLITGLAGLGKTHILKAFAMALTLAMREMGEIGRNVDNNLHYSTPQEFRKMGNEYNTLCESLQSMRPLVLTVDEMHELYIRETIQSQRVHQFLKKAGDKTSYADDGRALVRWDDETVIDISRRNFCFIGATNFPEKIKDSEAFRSRIPSLVLDLMSESELTTVLMRMLSARDIRACEETIGMIARCGRGTCRPLEKVVDALETRILSTGKKTRTINKADVFEVMALLLLYPRGLSRVEMRLLEKCDNAQGSKIDHLALAFGVEPAAMRKSVSYVESLGFTGWRGSYVVTGDKGRRHMANVKAAGLVW
jgi:Holliday junction resolvasome RuvABC ATP-dependent DNA helicase subunit